MEGASMQRTSGGLSLTQRVLEVFAPDLGP